jgi:hypothetical protein
VRAGKILFSTIGGKSASCNKLFPDRKRFLPGSNGGRTALRNCDPPRRRAKQSFQKRVPAKAGMAFRVLEKNSAKNNGI